MTAEQYLLNNRVEVFGEYGDTSQMEEFAKAMQEYTRIKCQELLEIVAEKVNIRHTFTSAIDGKTTHSYDKIFSTENSMFTIDKDSLVNVVDLEKFCS